MLEYITNNIWAVLLVANYIVALIAAIFIIGNNRNPVSTFSYVLSILVFPFVGLIIYYFVGREYRKSKMFRRKGVLDSMTIRKWEDKLLLSSQKLKHYENNLLGEKIKQVKLIQNNQKKPLTFNNEAEVLINGENKFKRLFEDLKQAKHHIHLEYYIFNSNDKVGDRFVEILCQKAEEGLEIRVIYDYVVSNMSKEGYKKMEDSGIEIFPFMPVRFPNLTRKLNYRDHRKVVVIDGEIGYLGGVNISDRYVNTFNNKMYWRDTHLRLKGDAVKSIQTHFLLNWNFVSGGTIAIKDCYFPIVKSTGDKAVQIAASGPDSDFANIMESYFMAISNAKDYVYITTPYFIPNEQILTALKTASRGGVTVKLLVPRDGDSRVTDNASDSYMEELLESGIEVYHYYKGMIHAKTMVVDGIYTTIGTCNMDYRSFEINFEINAMIYNKKIASEMVEYFNEDLKGAKHVTLEEWNKRSALVRWKDSFFRLWAPLL